MFTTHTPVAAAFDTFPLPLMLKYGRDYARRCGIAPEELVGLGRANPDDRREPFNMAYLAARSCARANGVSELHGRVSRTIFAPLFPRWPEHEVPVTHVTNARARALVGLALGRPPVDRGVRQGALARRARAPARTRWRELSDAQLWDFRGMERRDLVDYARRRLQRQFSQRGESEETVGAGARRARPERAHARLRAPLHGVQAPDHAAGAARAPRAAAQRPGAPGAAHHRRQGAPARRARPRFVRQWAEFVRRPEVRARAVFLEDYDMALAENLVQGVDVWINTPRRPWEASGTSGMKVLVNGGLNLSELDGWWAEAYAPDLGWAIGDGREHLEPGWDAVETEQLFTLLEQQVVPEFYARDADGIPRAWVARIRASLARLTPRFSSNRMLAEYLERLYLPAAGSFRRRTADTCRSRANCASGSANCGATGPPSTGATSTSRRPATTARVPRAGVPGRDRRRTRWRRAVRRTAPRRGGPSATRCGATTR